MPLRTFSSIISLFFAILIFNPLNLTAQDHYFPPAGADWEVRSPADTGLDDGLIQEAVALAMDNENNVNRDLRIAILQAFSHEPYHDLAGPVRERGGPAGLILKDGYIVASWGDIDRVDMTFSVTKSYLSTVAGLARDRKLTPEQMEGSTFTISNLGMFGIEEFTAIINPPNACILAVGAIRHVPVVKDGAVVPGHRMKVTLSSDHRIVDGAKAAEFLNTFRQMIENPLSMLL